jgi:hypothetical protein
MVVLVGLIGGPSQLRAQGLEIAPVYGYRFGGDFFELITAQPVDLDGGASIGLGFEVPLGDGLQVSGLFTRQKGDVWVPATTSRPLKLWEITVDHWLAGGLQEFGGGRVRPFATGMFGLTRYGVEGDNEIRFTMTGGGGVKLFPTSHIGVRLDGRIFATIVDAHGDVIACVTGACLFALHAAVVWQAEFTAGLVARFP